MADTTLPQSKIAVHRGEVYRIPRNGIPARLVRVVSLSRKDPQQPRALLVPVSRSGEIKGPRRIVVARNEQGKPTRTVANHVPHVLTWREGAWRLPASWSLVDPADGQ